MKKERKIPTGLRRHNRTQTKSTTQTPGGKDITHHGVQTDSFTSTCIQYTCKIICLNSYIVQRSTVKEHNIQIIRNASFQRTLNAVSSILRRGGSVTQYSDPFSLSLSLSLSCAYARTHTQSYFNICIYGHSEHSV
jgi:hypothetical protein